MEVVIEAHCKWAVGLVIFIHDLCDDKELLNVFLLPIAIIESPPSIVL